MAPTIGGPATLMPAASPAPMQPLYPGAGQPWLMPAASSSVASPGATCGRSAEGATAGGFPACVSAGGGFVARGPTANDGFAVSGSAAVARNEGGTACSGGAEPQISLANLPEWVANRCSTPLFARQRHCVPWLAIPAYSPLWRTHACACACVPSQLHTQKKSHPTAAFTQCCSHPIAAPLCTPNATPTHRCTRPMICPPITAAGIQCCSHTTAAPTHRYTNNTAAPTHRCTYPTATPTPPLHQPIAAST